MIHLEVKSVPDVLNILSLSLHLDSYRSYVLCGNSRSRTYGPRRVSCSRNRCNKPLCHISNCAEEEGFEPPNPSLDQTAFKAVQFANTVVLPISFMLNVWKLTKLNRTLQINNLTFVLIQHLVLFLVLYLPYILPLILDRDFLYITIHKSNAFITYHLSE